MTFLNPFQFPRTGRTVKNRLCVAAMTNKQSHENGVLSDEEYHWLVRRAEGGFGIVTTCAAHVSPDGQGWEGELGVHSDEHIPGLRRLAEGINQHGALSLVQIFHGGCRAPSNLTGVRPISASEFRIDTPNWEIPRAATEADIERFIGDFAAGAKRCAAAGFDGVEIHGAHGYLITQFLSTQSNTRQDQWGGSLENRARFLRAVLQEVKSSVPKDFIVGVRISPENLGQQTGLDIDENLQVARWIAEDGADFLHVSTWELFKTADKYPASKKTICQIFREVLPQGYPLFICGGFERPEDVEKALLDGADIVGMARCAIGNPDWPQLANQADYLPDRPPFSKELLAERGLGPKLISYMEKWPGFVKPET